MTRNEEIAKALRKRKAHISISDHAVVRYLERKMGVPMDEVRNEIRENLCIFSEDVTKGKFPLKCGGNAVILENNIVTIV